MVACRIARSHGGELVFEGVCITTASGNPDDEVAPGRWHEISIYRRADDAWVVSIKYCTRFTDEQEHTEAEVVDDAAEIESLLLSYEPWEHVNRRFMSRLSSDVCKRVSNHVWKNYVDLVNRVLEDLALHVSASGGEANAQVERHLACQNNPMR